MNFALGGIVLIILLLPGAISISSYYSTIKTKESSYSIPISDLLIKGLLCTFILHASALCIIELRYKIDYTFLYYILIGKEGKDFNRFDLLFSRYLKDFILYTISLIAIGFFCAKIAKHIICKYRININYPGFKNYNYWFYLFSANYSEGSRKAYRAHSDIIVVDIMTSPEYIFSGILVDFYYSPQRDELENVVLEGTTRRIVDKEGAGRSKSIVDIPGDVFVINTKDVLNINIKYVNTKIVQNA